MDDNVRLLIFIVTGPIVAMIVAGIIGLITIITGVDPLITTGVALEVPDIRPLSEIVPMCLLAPITLWAFIGLLLFVGGELEK